MPVKFTNNATSSLAAGISAGALSLAVAPGEGALFPTLSGNDYFYATLAGVNGIEIVKVTARATDTFTIVRAQDNTTAKAYNLGETVELRPIAAAFAIDALLPDQASAANKVLTSNGTVASWSSSLTGLTVASITLTGTTTTAAINASGAVFATGGTIGTSMNGSFIAGGGHGWVNTGAAADNRIWDAIAGTSTWALRVVNDAYSSTAAAMSFSRSGNTITSATMMANAFALSTSSGLAVLNTTSDGRIYGGALHNNAGSVTGTTNQYIASGTYTATITLGTNAAACSGGGSRWVRVGNVVTVSGSVLVDPTAANTNTRVELSLPIASNFTAGTELCGTVNTWPNTGQVDSAVVVANIANDRAELIMYPSTTNAIDWNFIYSYTIL